MTTTAYLGDFALLSGQRTASHPADVITGYVGEFGTDFDLAALTDAYIDAINTALADTGITLHGPEFIGWDPARPDAADLIAAACRSVDLTALAQQFVR